MANIDNPYDMVTQHGEVDQFNRVSELARTISESYHGRGGGRWSVQRWQVPGDMTITLPAMSAPEMVGSIQMTVEAAASMTDVQILAKMRKLMEDGVLPQTPGFTKDYIDGWLDAAGWCARLIEQAPTIQPHPHEGVYVGREDILQAIESEAEIMAK